MATFNGEKYILQQLESIARQTLLPTELVVTDDGSTDATLTILEEFAGNAPFPVKVVRNPTRLGYADNFLKAASLCQGDLIAFCDQDDIWMEEKLRVCAQFFSDPEVGLAAHSAWTLLASGQRGRRFPTYRRTRVLDYGASDPFGFPFGFAMVIRSELQHIVDPASRPQKILGHDQWFWFLAAASGKITTIADALALYRQHDANLYGASRPNSVTGLARSVAGTLEYDALADAELACSKVLVAAAAQNPDRAERLIRTARQLEMRSQFHRLRTRIYAGSPGFFRRATTFGNIFRTGGYLPDASRTRLGPRAGLKDLLFGVLGGYKLRASGRSTVNSNGSGLDLHEQPQILEEPRQEESVPQNAKSPGEAKH
jgi:hypothetical protein